MSEKIFCIGLSKTGTVSLVEALDILGYKSIHCPPFMKNSSIVVKLRNYINQYYLSLARHVLRIKNPSWIFPDLIKESDNKLILLNREFDNYNAFADTPIARFYKELDQLYPNSKFIYTKRDKDSWLKSCEKFFFKSRFDGWYWSQLHLDIYGINCFDKELFSQAYDKHESDVMTYFKDRQTDLLVLEITKGEGWSKLCDFLDKDIPQKPFPHLHKSII